MCGISKTTWALLIAIAVGLWMQFVKKGPMCTSKPDLSGRTIIVSGGNIGIGYETALALVKLNAGVFIACRNEQKAKDAVQRIKKEIEKGFIDYMTVDFADMTDIRRATEEFLKKEERSDILVNNAATVLPGKTKDGLDMMFGVNHIGYFMFTNLLMPLMRKTSKINPVRIVNVASEAYKFGGIDFDNLNPEINYESGMARAMKQYSDTKLMNIYFTSELNFRLKKEFKGQDQAITTYTLHPGTIRTNLGKEFTDDLGFGHNLLRNIFTSISAMPTVYGAQTTLCCSLEEGIEKFSGGFFYNLKHTELWDHALDPDVGRKLWDLSEEITGVRWQN